MANKQRMYRLTGAVKKKFPGLQKKRTQRHFTACTDIAREVVECKQYKKLASEYGFSIQTSLV